MPDFKVQGGLYQFACLCNGKTYRVYGGSEGMAAVVFASCYKDLFTTDGCFTIDGNEYHVKVIFSDGYDTISTVHKLIAEKYTGDPAELVMLDRYGKQIDAKSSAATFG